MSSPIDEIFKVIGQFGKYQKINLFLFCIAVVFTGAISCTYVFSAMDLNYRCTVPGCDDAKDELLENFIPKEDGEFVKCHRFVWLQNESVDGECPEENFEEFVNKSVEEKCDQFLYETEKTSILKEFNLECDDNFWKLTLVGTVNNVGQLFGLPISGLISDRFGRRLTFIIGIIGSGIFGTIRSLSVNYYMFLTFEFLDAFFVSSTYASIFVLAVELVQPSKRVLTGTLICCCFALGEIFVGIVAKYVNSWRTILQIIYIPTLFFLSYHWLSTESIRWLISRGKIAEARKIITQISQTNKITVNPDLLNNITNSEQNPNDKESNNRDPLKKILNSPKLLVRFVICSFCWITCTFIFYGLTLNSVTLAGDSYLDFILTCAVEIPAYFAIYFLLDRFGRRHTIVGSYILTAVTCLVFVFVNKDLEYKWLSLTLYLIGKFGSTAAFATIYVITSEIFPTSLRHSLMGACSMFGRIGSMVAPQVPLLGKYWTSLPIILFSVMSAIAAILSLKFPETVNTSLPDTIEEAEKIGTKVTFFLSDTELDLCNKKS